MAALHRRGKGSDERDAIARARLDNMRTMSEVKRVVSAAKAWAKIDGSTSASVALPSPVNLVVPVVRWLPGTTAFRFDVVLVTRSGTL